MRFEAKVAVFMPKYPQKAEKIPPIRKDTGIQVLCRPIMDITVKMMVITTRTIATILYWLDKYA